MKQRRSEAGIALLVFLLSFACDLGQDEEKLAPFRQTIGPEGGALVAEGFALSIPAGALDSETEISVVAAAAPGGGYQARSTVFQMLPDGLKFQLPVSVSLELSGDTAGVFVFHSKRDAPGFDKLIGLVEGQTITVAIDHFSTIFAGLEVEEEDGKGGTGGEPGGGGGDEQFAEIVAEQRALAAKIAAFQGQSALLTSKEDEAFGQETQLYIKPLPTACGASGWAESAEIRCYFRELASYSLSPKTYEVSPVRGSQEWVACHYAAAHCYSSTEEARANSMMSLGEITISEVSEGRIQGSYSLLFQFSRGDGRLKYSLPVSGSFDAPRCPHATVLESNTCSR